MKSGKGIPESGEIYLHPFNHSIADDYFTTRWFVRTAEEQLRIHAEGLLELMNKSSEDSLQPLFATFGQNLFQLLLPFAKEFNAEVIIIGGNIAHAWNRFSDYLIPAFEPYGIQVKKSVLGEKAVFLGAAKLFSQ